MSEAAAVNVYHDLATLPQRYSRLFDQAQKDSFYFSLPWFNNFVSTVAVPERRLRIYAAETQGEPLAVLLMQQGGAYGLRELNPLSNYYTSLFSPILDRRDEAGGLAALARAIATEAWDSVDLHPLAERTAAKVSEAFKAAGMFCYRYFCFGNWYLNVNGRSYQQYFATLPAAVRNTLARKGKQARSKARIEVVTGRDGLQSALAAYHQIYNASWKVPEPYPGFIDGLAAMCADKGWLRLGVLRVDNEPAAAQIWIVSAGTAAIYKLAYDSRFAKLSVGSLLTAHLMEHVIDRDLVREVDYLTGDDGYKKDWMSDRRERFGVSALNRRTVKGLALIARHFAARLVKRALRHQTS